MRRAVSAGIAGLCVSLVAVMVLGGGFAFGTGLGGGGASANHTSPTVSNTSQAFNFSNPHPTWNSGNLCTPVATPGGVFCSYNGSSSGGGGGCNNQAALSYNFTGTSTAFFVTVNNLSGQFVYLNFMGHADVITINVTGSSGGNLNITIKQQGAVHLNVAASDVKVHLTLYSDAEQYVGLLAGQDISVWTSFVSAQPRYDLCPAANNTKTDSWTVAMTGSFDAQSYLFVNGVGYDTGAGTVNLGSFNVLTFQNTSSFTCSWTYAPLVTCFTVTPHAGYASASREFWMA